MQKVENNILTIQGENLGKGEGEAIVRLLEANNAITTINMIDVGGVHNGAEQIIADFVGKSEHIDNISITGVRAWNIIKQALEINKMIREGTNIASDGDTILHLASLYGLNATVSKILAKAPELINSIGQKGDTALHYAVQSNSESTVELLLNTMNSERIQTKNADGNTALHLAASRGLDNVTSKILAKAPELMNSIGQKGDTALHYAVQSNSVPTIELLLTTMNLEGIQIKNADGNTALHLAVSRGLDNVASKILAKAPELINSIGQKGYSVLHYAVQSNFVPTVELLLNTMNLEGMQIKNADGNTVLHIAASRGLDNVASKILAKAPELINSIGQRGYTALHYASTEKVADLLLSQMNPELIKVKATDGNTALHIAASKGLVDALGKMLAKAPELINAIGQSGYTALHYASTEKVAELLLSQMNPELITVKATDGNTALHIAASKGLIDTVGKILAKVPELINSIGQRGYTALHYASTEKVAELLLNQMNPELIKMKAADGNTALHIAASKGLIDAVGKILAKAPELINSIGQRGYSALHYASTEKVAELLLSQMNPELIKMKAADGNTALHIAASKGLEAIASKILAIVPELINIVDNKGYTALMYAAHAKGFEMVRLLIKHGADVTHSAIDSKTALTYAKEKNWQEGAELLRSYGAHTPHELKKIMHEIAEGNDRISGSEPNAILLLGNTGSGKSTLAHVLSSKSLKLFFHEKLGRVVYDSVDEVGDIKISHSKKSETTVPNKCLTKMDTEEVIIWDCPGFNDTDVGQNIANSFYIKKLYNQHQNMKFILVVSAGAIINERGDSFIRTLEQFCNNFVDIDKIMSGVIMAVTDVYFMTKLANLKEEMRDVLKCNNHLSENARKMLSYLSSEEKIVLFYGPGILFPQPGVEEIVEQEKFAHIIQEIQEKSNYVPSKDGQGQYIGKFHLSDIATGHCKSLLDMSAGNLEFIFKVLKDATMAVTCSGNFARKDRSVFEKNYEIIKHWLPEKVNYIRDKEPTFHEVSEFFLSVKHIAKLKERAELYASKILKVVDTDSVKTLEEMISFTENLLNIFEEYTIDVDVRNKTKHIAYAGLQMQEYCKLFSSLIDGKMIEGKVFNQQGMILILTQKLKPIIEEVVQIIDTGLKSTIVGLDFASVKDIEIGEENTSDQLKCYQAAINLFKVYPQEPECIKKQAQSYYKIGVLKKASGEEIGNEGEINMAIKHYLYALKLDNTIVSAYKDLGDIYKNRQDYKEAIKFYKIIKNSVKLRECYKMLLSTNDEDYQLREEYGDVWESFGVYDKAKKYYVDAKGLTLDSAVIKNLQLKIAKCLDSGVGTGKAEAYRADANAGIFYDFKQGSIEVERLSILTDVRDEINPESTIMGETF